MSLPRFLLGMLGVLFVFAIATYVATLSVWTTFIQTLLCAVLIQLGYFIAVLFLVWRGKDKKQDQASSVAPQSPADEKSGSKVRPLSGAERPRVAASVGRSVEFSGVSGLAESKPSVLAIGAARGDEQSRAQAAQHPCPIHKHPSSAAYHPL